MGRVADALKLAQGGRTTPQEIASADAPIALEPFMPNLAPAVDPWTLAPRAAPVPERWLPSPPPESSHPGIVVSPRPREGTPSEWPDHEKLVIDRRMPDFAKEQYRRLCAGLHHAQLERGIKVVMVISAFQDEGKTLTAANLALTLSDGYGRQVALVDGDLRRPGLHKVFGLMAGSGSNGLDDSEPVRMTRVRPSLALLAPRPTGSDPLSFLASARMRELIGAVRQQFDWVVLDTPPVTLLPDANILSSMVDAVVVVALMGRTPYKAIAEACDAVGRDRVFGVVLNRADERAVARAGYYRYDVQPSTT